MIILTLHLKQKYIIKSKLEEYFRNILLAKKIPLKVIKAVLFTVDNHEKDTYHLVTITKQFKHKTKWSQLNLMHVQSILGNNHRLPLSHMDKSYICLEETNQRMLFAFGPASKVPTLTHYGMVWFQNRALAKATSILWPYLG